VTATPAPEPLNGALILIALGVWLAPAGVVVDCELARRIFADPWRLGVLVFVASRALTVAADVALIVLLVTRRRVFRPAFAAVSLYGWLCGWLDRALAATLPLDAALIASPTELSSGFFLSALVCAYVLWSKAAKRSFSR
jgi:hypothetical protein